MMFTDSTDETEKLRVNNFRTVEKDDFSDRPDFNQKKSVAKTIFLIKISILSSKVFLMKKLKNDDSLTSHPFEDLYRVIYHETPKRDESKLNDDHFHNSASQ